jgi:parallel beta-helix repeat protein
MRELGKLLVLTLVLIFLISTFANQPINVKAQPKTITVPDNYPTIQAAIGNASAGDTVFVRNGEYHENVVVNKSIYLIGEDKQETIIRGTFNRFYQDCTVILKAENIKIDGFTLTGDTVGVQVAGNGCQVIGNIVLNSFESGIMIAGKDAIVSQNNITGSGGWCGIEVYHAANVLINDNYISEVQLGVTIQSSVDITINGNCISGNGLSEDGIELDTSVGLYISGNNITNNSGYGIAFYRSCYNASVYRNNISGNDVGVRLLNFVIYGNTTMIGKGNCVFKNNMIGNKQQVIAETAWDGAQYLTNYTGSNATDVVSWDNGSVGNYWSDYNGNGSYVIDQNNIDHYPLTQPVDISLTDTPDALTVIVIVVAVTAFAAVTIFLLLYRRRHRLF